MTTQVQMLMYSKEANNRKQEIDRQHHTIPNQTGSSFHREILRPISPHCMTD